MASFVDPVAAGLLSVFGRRLGKYVNLNVAADVVDIQALRQIKAAGIRRDQPGLVLKGATLAHLVTGGKRIGRMTNCVWPPRMQANIGCALIAPSVAPGKTVQVLRADGPVSVGFAAHPRRAVTEWQKDGYWPRNPYPQWRSRSPLQTT